MFSGNTSQVSDDKLFVEDVFSTYLYTGNGSTQTITNGIDLAGKGGLVWSKRRSTADWHTFFDTARTLGYALYSNTTGAETLETNSISSFNSTGYSFGSGNALNRNEERFASWTFRKAPKFFDVVTYTGDGSFQRLLNHSLGVSPGFIVVKRTDTTSNWWTYNRGAPGLINGYLNLTDPFSNIGYLNIANTSLGQDPATIFRVFNSGDGNDLNVNGGTYVAYLFAHDATSDGIIQCGSYTGNGSATGPVVNLGWEPQWLMVKRVNVSTSDWNILDNMRGMPVGTADATLQANSSSSETSAEYASPTATGFQITSTSSQVNTINNRYVYIAIRRGPMRTPTLGTSVFAPVATRTATGATVPPLSFTSNFPVDLAILGWRDGGLTSYQQMIDRLRMKYLTTSSTGVEGSTSFKLDDNNGMYVLNIASSSSQCAWMFRRAPGFFDEVCWTGNGINPTSLNHNLGVAPELIITKKRNSTSNWTTGYAFTSTTYKYFFLNDTGAANSDTYASSPVYGGNPTSSVFIVGNQGGVNILGDTYVSYLFASCPGVSKIGSYTGNGSSQTINCGFAAGARFVMIKRTNATGDWYVWDTARGIVAGNDPHLSLNTTAAEVTTDDTIDTDSSGFVVNQVAATNVNVSSATYIYLAIA